MKAKKTALSDYIVTEKMLACYLELQEQLERIARRKEEMRLAFIEHGNMETDLYTLDIQDKRRSAFISLDKAAKKLGLARLKKLKLLRRISYKNVIVKRKAA